MKPLEGIRVLDCTRFVAGSGSTRILAAFGAEVIRVEWPVPPALDPVRHGQWNADKLSITLNLRNPKAIQVAKRLLAISDVFSESMRPQSMRNLGLDYETAKTIRPDIIYLSMSGWGQDGPRRDWGSYGGASAAHTGLTFLAGLPGRIPAGMPVAYNDENPPWLAASAVLTALHHRQRTGEGMYIDIGQTQAAATFNRVFYLDRSVNGRSARRPDFPPGNTREYPPSAPHNVFPCRAEDTWCAIAVTNDEEWQGLKEAMKNPNWVTNSEYDTQEGRFRHREEVEANMIPWTKKLDRFSLAALLQNYGVPAGPVETSFDLAEFDVQLAHRGTFRIFQNPESGASRYKTWAPLLSRAPYEPKRGLPTIGQDNLYIFSELLNMSEAEIMALASEDAIRGHLPDGADAEE